LQEANPCLVTVRFKTAHQASEVSLPDSLNTAWTSKSVSIVTNSIDKCGALRLLCESADIPLSATLYAGNDSNDLPVFCMPELKEKVFVGPLIFEEMGSYTKVASPVELGLHFERISKGLR
jgi:hypothetical protein